MRFADVKVGDQVVVGPPGRGTGCRTICQVEKVTATQFQAGGYRFGKSSGRQIGGDEWYPATVDLLERRRPAPVPVSERLPDASDPGECRMPDGDCWWFDPHADGAWYFDTYQGNYTHWLPAHALPLPAGEVQP